MPPIWQIRLRNPDGAVVAILERWTRLRISPVVNAPGGYELEFADTGVGLPELFEPDGQLEFWRRHADYDIDWRKEFEAFHVNLRRWVDTQGVIRFQSRGVGYTDLLNRRIIEAAVGSAEGAKSDFAETVIKEYVDEQAGPSAGARALTGLGIEADGGGGNAVSMARSYRNLLTICQEITKIGGGDFAVVGTGPATFEFRWYEDQLGTDRRDSVRFALAFGNMGEPEYALTRSNEANAILVAGQGAGADRETVWRTDAGLIDDSPWNRREDFVDARDVTEGDMALLNARGDARLEERRPVEGLSFKVIQTAGTVYGRDYFLGDLVRGEFAGIVVDQKIEGLVFTVAERQERLEVVLRDA